jgi:hypothetical protein
MTLDELSIMTLDQLCDGGPYPTASDVVAGVPTGNVIDGEAVVGTAPDLASVVHQLTDVQAAASSAAASAAAATDASNFTGKFPASVLANAPTGPIYNLSGITPIGGLMPLPVVLEQYCAVHVTIPLTSAVAGDTLRFVVTSMADRSTILWETTAAVNDDGMSVTVTDDDTNTQTQPPNGWYWFLLDITTKLRVGEGPLLLEEGPPVS